MRRRIEIKNETRWRTDDLRRLIQRACVEVFDPLPDGLVIPKQKPVIRARIVYAGTRKGVTGCANLGGTWMTLRIGTAVTDLREVGALIVHELGHLRGLDHPHMRGAPKWTWKGLPERFSLGRDGNTLHSVRYERHLQAHRWAEGFPLRFREERAKPRVVGLSLVEQRRAKVLAALGAWEAKERRAKNALRKLRARLRYYDRRAAALRRPSEGGET